MNNKIKYRLLGLLVIVGIIIIILPFFQTKEISTDSNVTLKAPPFPEPIQKQEVVDESNEEKIEEKVNDDINIKNINIKSAENINNQDQSDSKTPLLPLNYAVQLGSFKNKNNAIRLVNRLRKNGYQAFLRHIPSAFGESTRVYVGPKSKQEANFLISKLEEDFHIKGIIVHYEPLVL